jgi:bacillithiol system protein YtxJ
MPPIFKVQGFRMPMLTHLKHPEEFRDLLRPDLPASFLLYKHSPICELSAMANEEVQTFLSQENETPKSYIVDVIGARPTSLAIEEITGIRHESPQAMLFIEGHCVWNASHRKINLVALKEAWAQAESWKPLSP